MGLFTATAYLVPQSLANFFSSCLVFGPVVSIPDRSTSVTAFSSCLSIIGLEMLITLAIYSRNSSEVQRTSTNYELLIL